ncbi:long-chain-fatty-acid--CoA ligase [Desulfallas thermosapovorans]|uniref:Long-chain acyl-CoA synthetase n=1 Tax=Desulfallas thermosapovorans DSM 6562 TaxID=1121431 RepID=A0A5S4ZTJ2_9FIRM|nr:long-chain fatty acid--CoA ligase [Desulfallas thermosapovorans]TYO96173.1 long-chain acyl-CoA synthetase [Desulfallas thermosapovorans DSM 6562]
MDFPKPYLKIYEAGGVNWEIKIEAKSLPEALDNSVKNYPNNVAIIFYGKKITYAELGQRVKRVASALHDMGLRKGDRVSLMLPNSPDFVTSYYAILTLGGIVVNTNPMYVEREIEHQVNDSGSKMIIALADHYPKIRSIIGDTCLEKVILTSLGGKPDTVPKDTAWLPDLYAVERPEPPKVEIDPVEDVALFQYTGGTTGAPKAAMLTHYNLYANISQSDHFFSGGSWKERIIGLLPFFHVAGMTSCMNICIAAGTTMIPVAKFVPAEVVKIISEYEPTFFNAVPTMYTALLNSPETKDFNEYGKVKLYKNGAAPIPDEIMAIMRSKLEGTGSIINDGYGLSEASPTVISCPPFDLKYRKGSIGIPYPGTHAAVVDVETGTKVLPIGEVGELIVKGPQVMKGYWNRPDDTANALRNGWLYTGDMARMDEDGYFYIVDRKKDVIIAGGYNIYPREVEEVLYQNQKILEVVVAGVPHEYRGETVKAYIVLKDGQSATEEEIIAFCKERLAPYKVPKLIEFRKELPKSTVGKMLKRKLVEEEHQKLGKI